MSITALALYSYVLAVQGDSVATINGEDITSQTYHRRMEYLPGLGRVSVTGKYIEILPAIATLDTMVTEMLILQIAKTKGLTPTDAEIDKEIAYRMRLNPNYTANWQRFGRTLPELRQQIKVERAQFKIQTEGVVVTETEIKNNYDAAKATRFTTPSRVKLRVITVRDEATKNKVDTGIKGGKKFADLAKEFSTDSTKSLGGDLGIVDVDLLSEGMKTAIKTVKKGDRTGWLANDSIFAKFQVEDIIPAVVIPLDENVKEDIRRDMMLLKGGQRNDLAKMIREARQSANIKIASPEIDKAYREFVDLEKKASGGE